ncbi:S53 family peptidase [Flexivirga caeni]|uniref:Peptidase S53 n=1 Tax=Flexivirga caeni TaxID=2294115 RepID=A0A3M9M4A7_9MICO|nr:S53 family peptidase [Flexivirga caeni]RNI20326.1 peptidase S53 [Flexivirga caeni]
MPRSRSSARAATVAGAGVLALAFAASLGTGTAHAAGNTNRRVAVGSGTNVAAIPGARVVGTAASRAPEQVSFILKERNKASLAAQVERGFNHHIGVAKFAARYGQSTASIHQLTHYLATFGIKTSVYRDHVDVTARGTVGEFNKALGVHQENYTVPAQAGRAGSGRIPAQVVRGTSQRPQLPTKVADNVLAVLGLSTYSPFTSDATHVSGIAGTRSRISGNPTSKGINCVQLSGSPYGCNTPSDFVARYGLARAEKAGDIGKGRTVGIVTLAALDKGAPQYFWSHVMGLKTKRKVTVQNIDGGPGAPSDAAGTGETDLDVEQSGGVASGANVVVYQAANTDNGFADAFFTAATQNKADSVSSSWGESETVIHASVATGVETPTYQAAFDEAFLEMAAQGQSAFASAGDEGAYDATADLKTTNLAVDSPADSPYITSAGGTTLPISETLTNKKTGAKASFDVTNERAWAWDYLWKPVATINGTTEAAAANKLDTGGGGGFSTVEPRPSYQRALVGRWSAVPYLTPTGYQTVSGITEPTTWRFNGSPKVISRATSSGRAEPDVSADADPYTGYLLYEPSAPSGKPALQAGWGGTSYVAPQLNGSAAVIDSALGHRVGFLNPALYRLAAGIASPMLPLNRAGTTNDNLYYTGTPGTKYNPATGLGTPNLGQLITDLKWNW